MKKMIITIILLVAFRSIHAQSRFSDYEFSINGFRNPSIGLEFRYKHVSIHSGYYLTALKPHETTNFIKTGISFWFLPVGKRENPSSFYAGINHLYGLNNDYDGKSALGLEVGFRWMVWKGLNIRVGGIGLIGNGESVKINPTGGISYSFFWNKKG